MMTIFGITIFVLVFFPFYGLTLRFHLGYVLKKLFETIGRYSLIGGTFLIILCIASLILGKKIRVGWFFAAIVLLWIGCWCTGIAFDFWKIITGDFSDTGGGSGFYLL